MMILNEIVSLERFSLSQKDKVEIHFPKYCIAAFDDYHEVKSTANLISTFTNKKIKSLEINLEDFGYEFTGKYSGVFYISKKPTAKEIKEAIDAVASKLKLQRIKNV